MDKNFGKGFGNGMGNFKRNSQEYLTIRQKIMEILKIRSFNQFMNYKDGSNTMDVDEARQVEELFKSYGIEHPWNQI